MELRAKSIRYYYWLILEFIKKHVRLILLSFFLTFFIILSLIVFTPYLSTILTLRKDVIGITGNYYIDTLPDEVTNKISHGLVVLSPQGQIIPALASSWESRNKDTEFRFHLKKDLFWGDGKAFSAKDINYKFKDVKIEVKDDSTIYFTLKKSLAIFPIYLTQAVIRHPLDGVAGSYKVERVKDKYGIVQEIQLSSNKDGLPGLTYKFYDSEDKLINAYKRGDINQMTLTKKSIADSFSSWKNSSIQKTVDYTRVLTLFFNLKNSTLSAKEIRQAIAQSVPKDNYLNQGQIAQGPITPVSWAYNADVKKTLYDPEIAKKNIIKNDATASATLEFKTYYDYLDVATDLKNNFDQLGLKTNLSVISLENDNKFDLLLAFWKLPQDPDQYYFWHSTQIQGNITNYKNVKVDKLLEDGRDTLSLKKRKGYYLQFQKVLADDTPAVFIYYPYIYTVKRK